MKPINTLLPACPRYALLGIIPALCLIPALSTSADAAPNADSFAIEEPVKSSGTDVRLPAECFAESNNLFAGLNAKLGKACAPSISDPIGELTIGLFSEVPAKDGAEFWGLLSQTLTSLLEGEIDALESRAFVQCVGKNALQETASPALADSILQDLDGEFLKQSAKTVTAKDRALFKRFADQYATPTKEIAAKDYSKVDALMVQSDKALDACDYPAAETSLTELRGLGAICEIERLQRFRQLEVEAARSQSGGAELAKIVADAERETDQALAECDVEKARAVASAVSFNACDLKTAPVDTLRTLKAVRDKPKELSTVLARIPEDYNAIQATVGSCSSSNSQSRLIRLEGNIVKLESLAPQCVVKVPEIARFPQLKAAATNPGKRGRVSKPMRRRLAQTRNDAERLIARARDRWLDPNELKQEIVRLRRVARKLDEQVGRCDPSFSAQVKQVISKIDSVPIAGERGNAPRRAAKKEKGFFGKLFGGSDDEVNRARIK